VRAVTPSSGWLTPWVQLKYFSYHPSVYARMIAATSPRIEPGALVTVYDRNGEIFGSGFYNGRARVPLRVVQHGSAPIGEEWFPEALERAVSLRRGWMRSVKRGVPSVPTGTA
jgi:23S rRNA (cytosine1962-C5)-methyltransferase